ncbi:MAG: PQQ-dependent sugar dehydrogenase, partial [Planctomycetes bacterium]|nr:PQQ-dependent sugar dehydrogenase [Planctomycetota bacterium]
MSSIRVVALMLFVGCACPCVLASPPADFQNQLVISDLDFPMALEFLPDGTMLVAHKGGLVGRVEPGLTTLDPVPFLTIPHVDTFAARGVYDLILDPNFIVNGYVYVFYSNATVGRNRVSRFVSIDGIAVPSSEVVVWQDEPIVGDGHYGGGIAFGPDGRLYIAVGEELDGPQAQDLHRGGGKIHRVNPDGSVPTDNPFFDGTGPNVDSIWALGFRNPFRMHWDLAASRLFVGDVS